MCVCGVCVCVCLQLPTNQSFYRQITGYKMSVDNYRMEGANKSAS